MARKRKLFPVACRAANTIPVTTQHTPNKDRITRIHRNDVVAARQERHPSLQGSGSVADELRDRCRRRL